MRTLLEDVRHALRVYRRTPGASLMVVLVLAIGMAFVAAFLSLYSDLILRPEPGFEPGRRIISVGWNDGRNAGGLPMELTERVAQQASTLDALAGTAPQQFRLGEEKEQAIGEMVTSEFFPGLRPRLGLGRGFTAEEHNEQGEPVVVISWRYWQERYAGRPDVLGEVLQIHGAQDRPPAGLPGQGPQTEEAPRDFRIIGVMGRDFTGTLAPQGQMQTDFWLPVERGLSVSMQIPAQFRASLLRSFTMRGIARRADGVRNEAVIAELTSRFADEEFMQRPGARYEVIDRIVQNIFIHRDTERQLQLFLGGSVLLALVAAANVSLFLLARAPGRRRELGIRMAVGAPVRRLLRQLASEAAVLVAAGAALGLALSVWLAGYLRGLPFLRQAQWRDVTLLDWRVLALVAAFLLLVTVLVSLAPVLGLKRLGIAASSRLVSARATLAQRIAGTAQVAVAGMLGGAAVAFGWYLVSTMMADPGYRTDDLIAVNYSVNTQGRPVSLRVENGRVIASGIVDAGRRREAFAAVPGVTAVSMAIAVPGADMGGGASTVADPQNPGQNLRVRSIMVDDSYVDLLGLTLLAGRNLTEGDEGVLVNQTFARRFFGHEDVVGEPLPDATASGASGFVIQGLAPVRLERVPIVGLLKDFSFGHPLADIDPMLFSATGLPFGGVALVESMLPVAGLRSQLEGVARELDLNLTDVKTLAHARREVLAPDRARGLLTIGTAVVVVLLAGFGFYGTQRYLVSAGRREYAIRASLGAGPRALGRLVLSRGLWLGLPGLVLGVPLAFILVAWLRDEYISRDVSPAVVALIVLLGLMLLLLLASLGPARLARNTQPAPLLRED